MKIGSCSLDELAQRLRTDGIALRFGSYRFLLQTRLRKIAVAIRTLYPDYPLLQPFEFSDFHVRLDPSTDWGKPTVIASVNGEIWHIWPRRQTAASMEWIFSWCLFRGVYRSLAMHAAVAALPNSNSKAIVFPGHSGAGKSTLASTLMMSGWRLLSDEIAIFNLADLRLTALGRPTILKGESLDLIAKTYGAQAVFGPDSHALDPPVRIAHLRPTAETVEIRGDAFEPVGIVFPERRSVAEPRLERLSPGTTFSLLGQYGINYRTLGEEGFRATLQLVKNCPAYRLIYDQAPSVEPLLQNSELFEVVGHRQLTATGGQHLLRAAATSPNDTTDSSTDQQIEQDPRDANPVSSRAARPDIRDALQLMVEGLAEPDRLASLSLPQWDQVVLLANHTELLAQLAHRVSQRPWWESLWPLVRTSLSHAMDRLAFNQNTMCFELFQLQRILSGTADKTVLLKGAAYNAAKFAWAYGRSSNDVDLLVSKAALPRIESALIDAEYETDDKLSAQDRRYFRRWLHELPPLKHPYRRVEVDVHFRLLPVSDPKSFDVGEFIDRSVKVADSPFYILDPVDRVLHTIVNLARTGEFCRAYRDLWDLRCMLQCGAAESAGDSSPAFDWDELVHRTQQVKLGNSVGTVLLLASDLVQLSVPDGICRQLTGNQPNRVRRGWMYRIMRRAAVPDGANLRSRSRHMALWAMEHYPLPRIRTWLDPLTWTKRIHFVKE